MDADAFDARLVEQASPYAFAATLQRLREAIEAAGLSVFATIDHAAGAEAAGLTLPPTTVLIYGHARGGTPIMLATPQAALDLPLRVLVREDERGRALVAFHPIGPLLQHIGVPDALANRLTPGQQLLVTAIQP